MRICPVISGSYATRFRGLKYENGESTKEKLNNENNATYTFVNARKSEIDNCKNIDMIVTDEGNIRLLVKTPRYLDEKYERFYKDKSYEIDKNEDGSIKLFGNKIKNDSYVATYKNTFKMTPVNNNGEYMIYKGHHNYCYNYFNPNSSLYNWIESDPETTLKFAKFLDGISETIDKAEQQYGMNCVDALNRLDELKEQQYRQGVIEKIRPTYTFADENFPNELNTNTLNILLDNKYKADDLENFGIHIARDSFYKDWPVTQISDKKGYLDEKYNRFYKEEGFELSNDNGWLKLENINFKEFYYGFGSNDGNNNYNVSYNNHEGGSNLSSMSKEHFNKLVEVSQMLDRVAKSAQRAEEQYGPDYLNILDEQDRIREEERINAALSEEERFRKEAIKKVKQIYVFEDEEFPNEIQTQDLKAMVDNSPKIECCNNYKVHIDRDAGYNKWPVSKVVDEKGYLDEKYQRFYNDCGFEISKQDYGFIIARRNNREYNIELVEESKNKYLMYYNDPDGGGILSSMGGEHFKDFTTTVKVLDEIAQAAVEAEKQYGHDFLHILDEQDKIREENYRKETIEKIKDTYIFDDEDLPQHIPTNYLTGLVYTKPRVDKLQHFGIAICKNSYNNLVNVQLVDKDNCINPKYDKYYKKNGYTIRNHYDDIIVEHLTTGDLYRFCSQGDKKYQIFYENSEGGCRLTDIDPVTIQRLVTFTQVMDNIASDTKGKKAQEKKEMEANYTGKKYYDADGDFMTETMFLDEIEPKVSALRFAKNNLSTADINNLSKLFEIEPDNVIHMSKKQYRELCKKYHSDKKGDDRVFRLLNNIYNAKD